MLLRRGVLYLATMLGVMLLLGIIVNLVCYLFQIPISSSSFSSILVLSAVMGFAGSIISLFLSKSLVKKSMRVQVISSPRTEEERWLLDSVGMLAKKKGVAMPEVGIYPSDEMNAFATGWNKDAALVAVSSGILRRMNRKELLAVLGHEMSHVQNGDMVTMALMQGVVNTFVYALSYIIAQAASGMLRNDRDERGGGSIMMFYLIQNVLQMIFGFLGTLAVLWFSRHREYAADAGSAQILGKESMIAALLALDSQRFDGKKNATMQALCIAAPREPSELLMSHPTIQNRVDALRRLPY